ncbi:putative DD41D transposase [Trichonephila clavipes]|nr:putative DD41D transposase [Trichonephila clavipes]
MHGAQKTAVNDRCNLALATMNFVAPDCDIVDRMASTTTEKQQDNNPYKKLFHFQKLSGTGAFQPVYWAKKTFIHLYFHKFRPKNPSEASIFDLWTSDDMAEINLKACFHQHDINASGVAENIWLPLQSVDLGPPSWILQRVGTWRQSGFGPPRALGHPAMRELGGFNGDRYRAMITNFFIPELNNHDVQELWFQQDGATCHTARATIDLLKDTFGDRLISRFGPVNWPPRSCDLTSLDYFLWGYVKSLAYADKPQTLDQLEDNIRRVIADIRPQMLEKVIENWTSRLDYIQASRGSPMPEIIFKM